MPTRKVSSFNGLDAAVKVSPLTVLVRGVLEWMLPAERLQALHEQAPRGWTRSLTIESLFWLIVEVVSGAKSSIFAAYQADQAEEKPTITVSHQAVYDKLGCMSPEFGTLLVRESAARLQPLLARSQPRHYPGLKSYRIIVIDGTDLGGSEHRLAVLRRIKAAGLPGTLVVAYDWATGICCDAIASEDAYTCERKLLPGVLAQAQRGHLFVMDRHYCTTGVMQDVQRQEACFVIRENDNYLRCRATEKPRFRGCVATGKVYEQPLSVEDTRTGEIFSVRRVILKLTEPTTEGEIEIRILSNLPAKVPAGKISDLYRERWTIESHFQFLKHCLHGEVESLGKPRAALLMMFMALVTSNALAVVRHAIRTSHGEEEWKRLSGYYLADELAKNYHAVDVLIEASQWQDIRQHSLTNFWKWTQRVIGQLRAAAFYKHPRGPKLPPLPKRSGKQRHHYATYRLLREPGKKP